MTSLILTEILVITLVIIISLPLSHYLALCILMLYLLWHLLQIFAIQYAQQDDHHFKWLPHLGIWKQIWQRQAQQRKYIRTLEIRLKALEQVRADFVANVSHELRTPLTILKGYLETLQDEIGQIDLPTGAIFAAMNSQADRMARIIQDLLLLSRLESVQIKDENLEDIHLEKLIATIIKENTALWQHKQLTLTIAVDPKLVMLGMSAEIYSAFSNLIINAIHYSDANDSLLISGWRDNFGIHISFKDTGIGIPSEHIARLTERFYRVDTARSHHTGGTGLGLAIVKHVLMRHQGTLHITSQVGAGSTFHCTFHNLS